MLINVILLNDIEKPDVICSLTFAVDEFSGLLLHLSVFSIIHSRSALIMNGALSDFLYWLNSIILVSSEGIMTLQKSLFSHTFVRDSSFITVAKEWRQFKQ